MKNDENVDRAARRQEGTSQFMCRRCGGGQTFTAAERDNHRARHKAEDAKKRGRQRRPRANSPSRSELTLFEEIGPSGQTPPRAAPPAKRGRKKSPKKRRSKKILGLRLQAANREDKCSDSYFVNLTYLYFSTARQCKAAIGIAD
ncbi:hypothetical protein Ocin01_18071 [Orchesella cincta]|uniref:Uncharacterized protein n=1 Tax=Orchesella cincta TaxID=48709 RepID=A0A1D2M6Q9_ORCCI|nr:hypothetical protein Ocin01_18071 [Orchesella cincta]